MITKFDKEYAFLSNFFPIEVTYDGLLYDSTEHAYQAAKSILFSDRVAIQRCETPGRAKRLGRKITLRKDWDYIKVSVMMELSIQKFSIPFMKEKLLETGNKTLIEGNRWGDTYWGCVEDEETGDWLGRNTLGNILMCVRSCLRYN